ncbi:MAG: hypothetical protein SPK85_04600 [Prevotella sp.]|nr:hypothetical protein [Prevotella sp.]
MEKTNVFKFNYSISVNEYDRNKDVVSKIKWRQINGSIQNLSDIITKGYAFCNCFNTDESKTFTCSLKKDCYLRAAYLICFDFDAVKYSVSEFNAIMSQTEIVPNITYTTQNNGKFKPNKNETYNNRYRVIYVIDTPILSAELYTTLHQQLKTEISLLVDDNNIWNDNTDKSVSHFFAGCKGTQITTDENVYNLQWLIDRYGITIPNKKDTQSNNKGTKSPNNNVSGKKDKQCNNKDYISTLIENKQSSIYEKDTQFEERGEDSIITLCDQFESDYYNLPISKIIEKYICEYHPIDSTPLEDNGELIINLPNNYTEIRRRFKVVERVKLNGDTYKTSINTRRKDGEGRRRNIYLNLLLRKRIKPSITLEEMLYCGLWELYYYIDNTSDDKITKNDIAQIAVNALFDECRIKDTNTKKYKINKKFCIDNNINAKSANIIYLNSKKKQDKKERDAKIKELYNPKITDSENINLLSENGISISIKTLRRWKKENRISKEYKKRTNKSVLSVSNVLITINATDKEKAQQSENKEQASANKELISTNKEQISTNKERISTNKERISANNNEVTTAHDNITINTDNEVNNSLVFLNDIVRQLKTENEIKNFDFNQYYAVLKTNNIITDMVKAKGNSDVKKGMYLKENNYIAFILYLQSKIKNNMKCKDDLLKLMEK